MTLLQWILGAAVALTGIWAVCQGQVVLGVVARNGDIGAVDDAAVTADVSPMAGGQHEASEKDPARLP